MQLWSPQGEAASDCCQRDAAVVEQKKSSMLLRFYSPKMKQGAHTAKKGREPHIVTGDASYSEQKCHPGLRYHGRASSKILLLKETVLGAQGQEPLLSD